VIVDVQARPDHVDAELGVVTEEARDSARVVRATDQVDGAAQPLAPAPGTNADVRDFSQHQNGAERGQHLPSEGAGAVERGRNRCEHNRGDAHPSGDDGCFLQHRRLESGLAGLGEREEAQQREADAKPGRGPVDGDDGRERHEVGRAGHDAFGVATRGRQRECHHAGDQAR
jgi:hypothetical protein